MGGFDESEPATLVTSSRPSLLDHFSALRDPRQNWRVIYPLPEILLLVLCATVSGMEDFVEVRLWGEHRLDFLRFFLPFERGLPAHDTLNDVVNALDVELFKTLFCNWVETLRQTDPDIIAIDGKTSRRSHARAKGRGPLHVVSAWAARQRLVLGQEAVDQKSNEIVAIPLLLERLELAGALVTIDAMGTQVEIAQKIVARGGDYLMALKANAQEGGCRVALTFLTPRTTLRYAVPALDGVTARSVQNCTLSRKYNKISAFHKRSFSQEILSRGEISDFSFQNPLSKSASKVIWIWKGGVLAAGVP